ncbi:MAG: hypothetical protein AAF290_02795 [Pseudomonadota bacterium]
MTTTDGVTPTIEAQEQRVLVAYALQWAMLIIPLLAIANIGYLLWARSRVPHVELRSHIHWQLATLAILALIAVTGLGLLGLAFAGVNTDAPLSIAATFLLYGIGAVIIPWFFYRVIFGTYRFRRQLPMHRVWL